MNTKDELLKDFEFNSPVSETALADFESKQAINLPLSYRGFLLKGNGGGGPVGEFGYANVWKIAEIADLNKAYKIEEYLPGYLGIGSDGGGEAFVIRMGTELAQFVQVPFVGLSEEDCVLLGASFDELLENLSKKQ